jgi:CubicO group peptidase (beta-lactamase class C family)
MRRGVLWLHTLLMLGLVLWAVGCAAHTRELYQVSGSLFALSPPPPRDGFRYGPFDGLSREDRFNRLKERFRERLVQKHVPGGAVAVLLDGRLAYSAGVGVLRAGGAQSVRSESRFRTASISKMLVAATIMSLVERDGLALERPLTDYLPYFRRGRGADASQVTLAMLLNHTGGIPDSNDTTRLNLRALIEAHGKDPFWSPPGRLFNYSNAGYALLAAVIEARTGRRFEDVVNERVFKPSGMQTATYDLPVGASDIAAGHGSGAEVIWTRPNDSEASRAAGGVLASVVDYAHFAEALLAGGRGVITGSSVEHMMTGRALMQEQPLRLYGDGLYETEQAGLHLVEHAGNSSGFSTLVRLVPARKFAVVVFDNGTFPPDEVADAAMSAFLDVPEEPRARVGTPAATWSKYCGFYDDAHGALGHFEIKLDQGRLWMHLQGGQAGPIPASLRGAFESDPHGNVEYFVTRAGVARKRR